MAEPVYLGTLQTRALGLIGVAVSFAGLKQVRMFLETPAMFEEFMQKQEQGPVTFASRQTAVYLAQIQEYLEGRRFSFSLPIDWSGVTEFQRLVLEKTLQIPYGETRAYGEIASALDKPKAARAVGQAERSNPNPLVIPCHRVIGADGGLVGYGGNADISTKAWLLAFEKSHRTES